MTDSLQPLMSIDGQTVTGPATFDVVNPATGSPFASAPDCSPAQLDEAMAAASAAFGTWGRDREQRSELLLAAAAALFAAADEVAPLLSAEQGKPVKDAAAEMVGAGVWFKYYARLAQEPEIVQDDAKAYAEVVRRPLGVVAAITPWNFPLFLAAWKLAPALATGNTIVLKPSPYTPLSTLLMGVVLNSVLPPGVVNVVSGGDELGRLMTAHATPRKVSFTGSVAGGQSVAQSVAADLKRVTLELGGNDAAIVLDDADVETIARQIFWGAFSNNGQVCSAIKRLYVPERLRPTMVEALAELAKNVRVGVGTEPGVELGPINNRAQFTRVGALVEDAVRSGARVAAGGGPIEGPGYFFQPTICTDLAEGVRLVDEEQFGPVLPVLGYDNVEDAVRRANSSSFGLSGSVWSPDVDRARAVADQLECGTAWVNAHVALAPGQPFGGVKHSGLGLENGRWGLEAFTDAQVRYTARTPVAP